MPTRPQAIFFALGLLLFGAVVWKTGWQTILLSFSEVGINYVWILLWPLFYYFLNALAWYFTIPPSERQGDKISLRAIFNARMVGEAINYFTAVGGEGARALFMRDRLALHVGAATVILDRALYFMVAILFILFGIVTANFILDLNPFWKVLTLGAFVFLVLLLAAFWGLQQQKFLSRWLLFAIPWQKGRAWLEKKLPQLQAMEKTMETFYRRRPRDFMLAGLCHFLARLGGTLEIWMILHFLRAFSPDSLWRHPTGLLLGLTWAEEILISLLMAAFVIVLNFAFFMFPSQVGIAEGGMGILFRLLGLDPALGVSVQIVRRVKSLAYIGLGLAIMGHRGGFTKGK